MLRTLSDSAAMALGRQLKQIACSDAWHESVRPHRNGQGWVFDTAAYPPGGASTTMRICAQCGRISPPNGVRPVCCDCQVEREESDFIHRCVAWPPDRRSELLVRWWSAPHRFSGELPSFLANPVTLLAMSPVEAKMSSTEVWNELRIAPGNPEDDKPRQSASTIPSRELEVGWFRMGRPSPTIRFFDPIPFRSLTSLPRTVAMNILSVVRAVDRQQYTTTRRPLAALRQACRGLEPCVVKRWRKIVVLRLDGVQHALIRVADAMASRNVSIGSGRAAGCQLTLLSENESDLRKEIAHVQEHGKLLLRARRFTRPNPLHEAPEDKMTVAQCFFTSRSRA